MNTLDDMTEAQLEVFWDRRLAILRRMDIVIRRAILLAQVKGNIEKARTLAKGMVEGMQREQAEESNGHNY